MGQIANITLTDAAATPVNRVFNPANRINENTYKWINRASGIPIGFDVLTLAQRPGDGKGATKLSLRLVTPILEVTSPSTASGIQPAPTIAYTPLAVVEFVLPDRCTLQNRKDLLAMMRDALSESVITTLVQDLDFVYGG